MIASKEIPNRLRTKMIMTARGETRWLWYISLAELAVNVVASVVLLSYFGLAGGVRFDFVGALGFFHPSPGNVETVLGVIEQAPGQGFDQTFLGIQRVFGDGVMLDPVAVVIDAELAVEDAQGTGGDRIFHEGLDRM